MRKVPACLMSKVYGLILGLRSEVFGLLSESKICLDQELGDVDIVLIGIEGLYNRPFKFSRRLIDLPQVNHPGLSVFPVAVGDEADLGPIDQLRVFMDLRDDSHLIRVQ